MTNSFSYQPEEHESERASNSYLMSLIALMVGLPLPIVNVIATLVFYFANRKATYFVRWHCTQALLSQLFLLPFNSVGFWWTMTIIFGDNQVTNNYFAYLISLVLLNIVEYIATIYTAVKTRNGVHVQWWFYGPLTSLICKR
jgi:hypothetical protein